MIITLSSYLCISSILADFMWCGKSTRRSFQVACGTACSTWKLGPRKYSRQLARTCTNTSISCAMATNWTSATVPRSKALPSSTFPPSTADPPYGGKAPGIRSGKRTRRRRRSASEIERCPRVPLVPKTWDAPSRVSRAATTWQSRVVWLGSVAPAVNPDCLRSV